MHAKMKNRILVSHVGSLVRPPALIEFLQKIDRNEPYDRNAFEFALKNAIDEAVRLQGEAGVDIVSDGEYGKALNWAFYVQMRLGGIERRPLTPDEAKNPLNTVVGGRDREAFPEFYAEYDARMIRAGAVHPVVTGPITYIGQAELQRDIGNLKSAFAKVSGVDGFLPVVAPASALPNVKDEYYGNEKSFWSHSGRCSANKYRAIIDAVFGPQSRRRAAVYVSRSSYHLRVWRSTEDWCDLRVAALNRALEDIPLERSRYHICWGSWNGPHMFDVPLKDILDIVLKVNVGAYSFAAANPRHEHEWHVWKTVRLPAGKSIMPGVVTHSTNVVEHPELVSERLQRFASCVGRENVIAGTDCGFSQSPLGARVHRSIMWAKLKTLSEGAQLASNILWGRRTAA